MALTDTAVTPVVRPPVVGVAVVTYNSADVVAACLASIPAAAEGVRLVGVVVADNASADATVALAAAFDGVTVLPLGRNAGYAAGVNAAVAALPVTDLDAVLVLNPDVRLRRGSIARLASALDRDGVGIAVPRLLAPDGSLQPSLRRPPAVRRAWAEALLGGHRAGRLGTLGERIIDPARYEVAGPVAWATGAALLVSRRTVARVGPWDESFLLYGEEVEYALRAGDLGYATWYVPDAVAEHVGGELARNPYLYSLMASNRVRLFAGRHGRAATLLYRVAVLAGEAVRAMSGRATSRAAVRLLAFPSRRPEELPQLKSRA